MVKPYPMISVKNLCLRAGSFRLQSVSLDIERGGYCILLGPTGCGKTLLVETICGLNLPESGTIHLSGRDVTATDPARRGIGYVPQDYALLPFKTVGQNVAFGLQARRFGRVQIAERVGAILEMLDIGHLADRFPAHLSGGERQRAALGRALAIEPDVMVLDEPLSALDEGTCRELMGRLKELHARLKTTFVHICHRVEEALTLGDMLAVMREGRIEQCGPPAEIFARPKNLFIAKFLQLPNVIRGEIRRAPGGNLFHVHGLSVTRTALEEGPAYGVVPLRELSVFTRPPAAEEGYAVLSGRIARNAAGPHQPGLRLEGDLGLALPGIFSESEWPVGREVYLRFRHAKLHVFRESCSAPQC